MDETDQGGGTIIKRTLEDILTPKKRVFLDSLVKSAKSAKKPSKTFPISLDLISIYTLQIDIKYRHFKKVLGQIFQIWQILQNKGSLPWIMIGEKSRTFQGTR